jgi:GNAT superfamily N-acetyltransferase
MTQLSIRPTETNEIGILSHLALFASCFTNSTVFTKSYLDWLYIENPAGSVIGFDAWDNDTLAGTYVCIPTWIVRNGHKVKALLSLNTATHENYRGQGLFTQLANATYEAAKLAGYSAVYGVANANSIGGFIRKLGFTDIGGLNARIGFSAPPKNFDLINIAELDFYRFWDEDLLTWRCNNPSLPLSVKKVNGGFEINGPTNYPFVESSAFLLGKILNHPYEKFLKQASIISMVKISLAVVPNDSFSGLNIELPKRLRPSPLRLIFRDLQNQDKVISRDKVYLTFADFDAF